MTTSNATDFIRRFWVRALAGGVMATVFLAGSETSRADWFFGIGDVTVGYTTYDYETDYDYDRISRERRPAAEVDDWLERGNATVTLSPVFDDGIRVAAWANDDGDDDYEFGVASAIYFFRIPREAREIRVRIRYEGNGYLPELGDEIAGRVWIRNVRRGDSRDNDEPLQGDTFVLRKDRRSETIRVPALGYVNDDGMMELHVVADGGTRIDVQYLEVETYAREPRVRVVRRYVPAYEWRPWRYYAYDVFYGGPFYFPTDYGYYVYWDFPMTDTVYIGIRRRFCSYLYDSWAYRYPTRRVTIRHYSIYEPRGTRYVSRWTPELNTIRDQYERSRTTVKERRPPDEALQTQRAVSSSLQNYQRSPVRSSVATQGYEYQKTRRGAVTSYTTRSLAGRSDSGATERRPSVDSKARRGSDTDTRTQNLLDAIRRSRTQAVAPSSQDDAKRRRAEPSGSSSYTERKAAPPAPSSASSSDSEKRRRAEESKAKSAPSSSSASKSKSSGSSSSSSSQSNDDDDEKKKKRR
jgi:hypothetical protein